MFSVLLNCNNFAAREDDLMTWKIDTSDQAKGTNVLGLVVFSIALGIALARMGDRAKPFTAVVDSLGEAIMMMTKGVIW